VAVLAAVVAAVWVARPAGQSPPVFAGGVDQVEVYATVTGTDGAPVSGLSAANFEVYENGRVAPIETFEAGRFPLTVALGVDRSWSMAGAPRVLARRAARVFLSALAPDDRAMVVAIDSRAEVVAPLDASRAAQMAAVDDQHRSDDSNRDADLDPKGQGGHKRHRQADGVASLDPGDVAHLGDIDEADHGHDDDGPQRRVRQ
jgi:hypothetical protein